MTPTPHDGNSIQVPPPWSLRRVPSAVSDDPHADVNLGSVVSLAARDSTAVDAEASSQAGPPAEPPAETSSIQWQRGELLGSGAFGQARTVGGCVCVGRWAMSTWTPFLLSLKARTC